MIFRFLALLFTFEPEVPPCQQAAAEVEQALVAADLAMNVRSSWLAVYERATEASERCPATEALGYIAVRALQLRFSTDRAEPEALQQARAFAARFPRSARIATARARLEKTVAVARSAVAVDDRYPPAQLALAIALLDAGDPAAARAALARIENLGALDDGYATLARVAWAEGRVDAAIDAARQQLVSPGGFEPGSADFPVRQKAHEILGLAYLKHGRLDDAASHLLAADPNAKDVRAVLEHPTLALRRALARHRRAKR